MDGIPGTQYLFIDLNLTDMSGDMLQGKRRGAWYLIFDAGFWILGSGCWILDTGFWMLGSGCWVLDAGYWIKDKEDVQGRQDVFYHKRLPG